MVSTRICCSSGDGGIERSIFRGSIVRSVCERESRGVGRAEHLVRSGRSQWRRDFRRTVVRSGVVRGLGRQWIDQYGPKREYVLRAERREQSDVSSPNATESARCGLRIYKPGEAAAGRWQRTLFEPGGVAIEDLSVADLDGDGRRDIIAVGRATHNVRIYWNQTGEKK